MQASASRKLGTSSAAVFSVLFASSGAYCSILDSNLIYMQILSVLYFGKCLFLSEHETAPNRKLSLASSEFKGKDVTCSELQLVAITFYFELAYKCVDGSSDFGPPSFPCLLLWRNCKPMFELVHMSGRKLQFMQIYISRLVVFVCIIGVL